MCPSLYTADYEDCLGQSAINVTRFDAAYYKDNMTIIFHLEGETALGKEDIMMNIGVFAYGESRFDLTFDPCNANIESACPVRSGVTIEAAGIIPVNQQDVAGIPPLALSIPDFEGQAILRLFSNSTQNEIGCFAAQITNGFTFEQKAAVSSILGAFTIIAVVASFATAIYGANIAEIRKHYAQSLSVSVVFAVWHHIFYSGAISMNWPSVLVAFWANYAWAGGIIYSEPMQNSINDFIGSNKGNTSQVGAAGTGQSNPNVGGGIDIHEIYKRDARPEDMGLQAALAKRHLVDANSGFKYYGQPVKPGLPLPGNYSGFAGTLATQRIPASNAFMTGLVWLLILTGSISLCIFSFKVALDTLSGMRVVKRDRFGIFRRHYLGYLGSIVLRIVFIGFFMVTFLAMFQFSYLGLSGPVAVACIVFVAVVFGVGSVAAYACFSRLRIGKYVSEPDQINLAKRRLLKVIPWFTMSRNSKNPRSEDEVYIGSIPWWTIHAMADATSIHDDEQYTKKFGWLASRYRRTRWWFFVTWLFYEFFRACFLAGASSRPLVQVFGLLAVEMVAFLSFIILRPFEGQRLNVLAMYLLGFSKVTTVGLSATFDSHFGIARIPTTVIGIIIIVIQGLLTVALLVLILIGAVSSYMSVLRNRTEIKPRSWNTSREKYFKHMDVAVQDVPQRRPRPVSARPMPASPKLPYFKVRQVKRMAKVEDEDNEFMEEINRNPSAFQLLLPDQHGIESPDRPVQRSRKGSLQSQASYSSLPRAARVHRPSWSTPSYAEPVGLGRHRALSDTRINMASSVQEHGDRYPSPGRVYNSRCNTPALSSLAPSDEGYVGSAERRVQSRLTWISRSSSPQQLQTRISEEDTCSRPEKGDMK
ncbi:transient receptor potential ion channel [Pyrenophora seminiperda CCB06]|uniref:Transient receptor potential ion channel n=1 Tax=Pyrenophora seminiperda CCB06 TaxID=1302712 RepID=A0A3M7M9F5_9PLEO|nr:transient receptor potential ion channel [Pyrenophora seminiperda CCB06]